MIIAETSNWRMEFVVEPEPSEIEGAKRPMTILDATQLVVRGEFEEPLQHHLGSTTICTRYGICVIA
jgi:hypothetical protein